MSKRKANDMSSKGRQRGSYCTKAIHRSSACSLFSRVKSIEKEKSFFEMSALVVVTPLADALGQLALIRG